MKKIDLAISFSQNVREKLDELEHKRQGTDIMGLAYVTAKYGSDKKEGWRLNLFGDVIDSSKLVFLEIFGYQVVLFNPERAGLLVGHSFDFDNGWLVKEY